MTYSFRLISYLDCNAKPPSKLNITEIARANQVRCRERRQRELYIVVHITAVDVQSIDPCRSDVAV